MRVTLWFLRHGDIDGLDAIEPRKVWIRRLVCARRLRLCDRCMTHRCFESARSEGEWSALRGSRPAHAGVHLAGEWRRLLT